MPTRVTAAPVGTHLSLRSDVKAPNLAHFRSYKIIEDVDVHGVTVPGLRGEFLNRKVGGRIATVGRYTYAGREVFRVWGYDGEEHCRFFAVLGPEGDWEPPQAGCPRVRLLADDGRVAGLALHSASGGWLVTYGRALAEAAAS
jgi:hypothetical protein